MLYFDTSVLLPTIIEETYSTQAQNWLADTIPGQCMTSYWAQVEFASAIRRRIRMGQLTLEQAELANHVFQRLLDESFVVVVPHLSDFKTAKHFLESYKTGLRAGDALHLAIAQNQRATKVYTLDHIMAAAAKVIGIPVARIPEGL